MKRGSQFLPGLILGVVLTVIVAAVVAAPLALTHKSAGGLETAYANAIINVVSSRGAGNIGANPVPGNSQAIQDGRAAFTGSCAQCHGAAADGKGVFGQNTFPPATDLTTPAAKQLSDQQMFYIIKNGLGFTGMPGYADQYSDRDIWSFVSYIRDVQSKGTKAFNAVTVDKEQLSFADFQSAESPRRGAAVWMAQGCVTCHGVTGDAPEQINFDVNSPETAKAIREGVKGMPKYGTNLISDAELKDVLAYMATFPVRDEEEEE